MADVQDRLKEVADIPSSFIKDGSQVGPTPAASLRPQPLVARPAFVADTPALDDLADSS
jgi:hypothetical protein